VFVDPCALVHHLVRPQVVGADVELTARSTGGAEEFA
jgi:hypothetical protein